MHSNLPLHEHTLKEADSYGPDLQKSGPSFLAPFLSILLTKSLAKSVFLLSLLLHRLPLSAWGSLISSLQQLFSGWLPCISLESKGETTEEFPAVVQAK